MSHRYKSESIRTDMAMHRRWRHIDKAGMHGETPHRHHREVRGYVYRLAHSGQTVTVAMVAALLGGDSALAMAELSALARENRALRPFIDLTDAGCAVIAHPSGEVAA